VDRNSLTIPANVGLVVAPYAGAWIETGPPLAAREAQAVAPYAGAWIETLGCLPR